MGASRSSKPPAWNSARRSTHVLIGSRSGPHRDARRGAPASAPGRGHGAHLAFGTTRQVPVNTPMVTFESGQYSVPHQVEGESLLGETVWVRTHGMGEGEQIVIVHLGRDGPREVARHSRAIPGTP